MQRLNFEFMESKFPKIKELGAAAVAKAYMVKMIVEESEINGTHR